MSKALLEQLRLNLWIKATNFSWWDCVTYLTMKKYIFIPIVIIATFVLLFLIRNVMTDEMKETEINFKRLNTSEFGLKANLIPAQKIIFYKKEQWKDFWIKYGSGIEPQIDFEKYIVAGIFLGEKPNPGYGVEITKVKKVNNKIEVKFTEYLPNPNLDYPSVLVYPYDIVYFLKAERKIIFSGSQIVRCK